MTSGLGLGKEDEEQHPGRARAQEEEEDRGVRRGGDLQPPVAMRVGASVMAGE